MSSVTWRQEWAELTLVNTIAPARCPLASE